MELIDSQNDIFIGLILMKNKFQHECATSVDKKPKEAIFFDFIKGCDELSHCFYGKPLIKTG